MHRYSMLALMLLSVCAIADDPKKAPPPKIEAFTSAAKAGPDFEIQGEYVVSGEKTKLGIGHAAQVIAMGDGKFEVRCWEGALPTQSWKATAESRIPGQLRDGQVRFENNVIHGFHGYIKQGKMDLMFSLHSLDLTRVVRESPTLGMKPPSGATVLFDGTSADHWDKGKLVEGNLLKWGTTSKDKFNDCTIHLEFRLPFMPRARGQERANSGVYVQGRYEVQILDSFGLAGKDNECGGIYTMSAPKVNMCYPPLSWQTYDIDFVAAKFDGSGKKTSDAVLTVRHNGVVIQDNVKVPGPTGGSLSKESAEPGPIHLQDHGDPVVFRNIWVLPKK